MKSRPGHLMVEVDVDGHDRVRPVVAAAAVSAAALPAAPPRLPIGRRIGGGLCHRRRRSRLIRRAVLGQFCRRDDAVVVEIHRRELPPPIGKKLVPVDRAVVVAVDALEPCRQCVSTARLTQRAAIQRLSRRAVQPNEA
jgi:hypothetical protein